MIAATQKRTLLKDGLVTVRFIFTETQNLMFQSMPLFRFNFLDSADSLRRQGCVDEPLLNIIGKNKYLAYVHVSSGSD